MRERDGAGILGRMETVNLPKATRSPDAPLTAIQVAFVEHFLRYRNATQAYKHASGKGNGIAYFTAAQEGAKLLRDARVQSAIRAGAKEAFKDTSASVGWLLQRFLDVATADPRELIGLKIGACRYCHGEGHGYQWREREYAEALRDAEEASASAPRFAAPVRFPDIAGGLGYNATRPPHPDCPQCHGEGLERFVPRDTDNLSDQALLLFGGVKVKPNGGYEIIIADRQKALENVGRIMGAFTDKVQHSGAIGALVAVDDLRKADPIAAAKAYREMIAGNLALDASVKRA